MANIYHLQLKVSYSKKEPADPVLAVTAIVNCPLSSGSSSLNVKVNRLFPATSLLETTIVSSRFVITGALPTKINF